MKRTIANAKIVANFVANFVAKVIASLKMIHSDFLF